jgi:uncharacterized protein (TIGR03435 family)
MVARVWHRLTAASAATAFVIVMLPAQEHPAQPAYGYEAVSIHLAAPGQMNSGFNPGPQGGMRGRNVTAMQVMTFAYSVQAQQIVGAPGWADSERFEISFTPDRSEIVPDRETARPVMDGWLARQRQRFQAVLRDRFGLVLREETREMPIYVLTVAKNGPKLTAPAHPERTQTMNINNGRQILGTTAPMKSLAEGLFMVLGRLVRDETGLDGAYDFRLDWTPDPGPASAADSGGPSIFTALTEQLGLRLESRKGPVPVFMIEKIERPSEN